MNSSPYLFAIEKKISAPRLPRPGLQLRYLASRIMEIFRHVYQIASLVADRNLFQYLFLGDNTILLDTGASYTPDETIFPFLKKVGLEPSRLTMAINTHADADHHGGNASLKRGAGQVMLAC